MQVHSSTPQNLTSVVNDSAKLNWNANTESDLWYYTIYRDTTSESTAADSIASVNKPDTTYTDTTINMGITYYYWATAVDSSGNESNFSVGIWATPALTVEVSDIIPEVFALHQNYPNPFNPITTLRYDLPEQSDVMLTIYDILGRHVRTLVRGVEEPGFKSVVWDGKNHSGHNISSGIYIYQIAAKSGNEIFVHTRKMVLLR